MSSSVPLAERVRIDSQARRVDEALERFKAERASLYRPDGTPKYSPQEHRERIDQLLAELDRTLDEVRAFARQYLIEAQQKRDAGYVDPFDRLSSAEQAKAANRAAFVKEDVESLPFEELEKRLRAAQAQGDRA